MATSTSRWQQALRAPGASTRRPRVGCLNVLATFGSASNAATQLLFRPFELHLHDRFRAEPSLELGRGAGHQHLAMIDDGHAVAQTIGLFHVVGGEQDRDALGPEAADQLPQRESTLRIQAGGWLVQKEHRRPVGDGPGDLHPLGQTPRRA